MKRLVTVFTSASRPDLFRHSTDSAQDHLDIFNSEWTFLNEDFYNEKLSKKVVDYAKHYCSFDKIIEFNPRIGLIGSCMSMLNYAQMYSDCDYVLRLCDDFVFTIDVDLPKLLDIMDKYKDVNQIIFNKRPNNERKGNFIKKEIDFDGQKLTTSPRWSSLNSIWRVDFIYVYFMSCWNRIKDTKKQFSPWKEFFDVTISKEFGVNINEIDADWIIKNLGCYYYGGIGDINANVCVHTGGDKSRVFGK
jgi:hypothetical protein